MVQLLAATTEGRIWLASKSVGSMMRSLPETRQIPCGDKTGLRRRGDMPECRRGARGRAEAAFEKSPKLRNPPRRAKRAPACVV